MSASIKKQSKAEHQMDLKIRDGIPDRPRNLGKSDRRRKHPHTSAVQPWQKNKISAF